MYHFGTIVSDDRTGAFQTKLTKILLSGDNGITFTPPASSPVLNVTSVNQCDVSKIVAKYYKEMIYMICTVGEPLFKERKKKCPVVISRYFCGATTNFSC